MLPLEQNCGLIIGDFGDTTVDFNRLASTVCCFYDRAAFFKLRDERFVVRHHGEHTINARQRNCLRLSVKEILANFCNC